MGPHINRALYIAQTLLLQVCTVNPMIYLWPMYEVLVELRDKRPYRPHGKEAHLNEIAIGNEMQHC